MDILYAQNNMQDSQSRYEHACGAWPAANNNALYSEMYVPGLVNRPCRNHEDFVLPLQLTERTLL